METKDAILHLRTGLKLSQREFAEKIHVTRQAVSRWETGETAPNTDTLKLIAKTFDVSIDYLLCHPSACQSCGMLLETEDDKGTEKDGSPSEKYCSHCYRQGKFTADITMEEMVELNLNYLDQWNQEAGLQLSKQEAREQLLEFLPTLGRWK